MISLEVIKVIFIIVRGIWLWVCVDARSLVTTSDRLYLRKGRAS